MKKVSLKRVRGHGSERRRKRQDQRRKTLRVSGEQAIEEKKAEWAQWSGVDDGRRRWRTQDGEHVRLGVRHNPLTLTTQGIRL